MTHWANAPIRELAIGLQFEPMGRLTNAHLGAFWASVQQDFPIVRDSAPRDVVVELFGKPNFVMPGPTFAESTLDTRFQLINADRSRMLQIQNGWLVVNWVRTGAGSESYPGFSELLSNLESYFAKFQAFAADLNLGDVKPTVWELTYIDHIEFGPLFQTYEDLPEIFSGLLRQPDASLAALEGFVGKWAFTLPEIGRLTMHLQTGLQATSPDRFHPSAAMTSTARGPVTSRDSLRQTLTAAKKLLVQHFEAAASEKAKTFWKGDI